LLGTPAAYISKHSNILKLSEFWLQKADVGKVEGSGKEYLMNDRISDNETKEIYVGVLNITYTLFWFIYV
jgi:hypothetical protein